MTALVRGSIVTVAITVAIASGVAVAPPRAHAQTTTEPAGTSAPAGSTLGRVATSTSLVPAGDKASTRTVNRIVLALLALGGLVLVLTMWLWRTSKPVPRHLDALDAMGSRQWRRASVAARSTMLAPVHERRGEIRDEELIAEPEPAEARAGDADEMPAGAEVVEVLAESSEESVDA